MSKDPSPFLNHLDKILPNAQDRAVLMAYLAACVQYRYVKFQWCSLLQGVEGNGKSIFANCAAYAIGKCYTRSLVSGEIGSLFNNWVWGARFVEIEGIYDLPEWRRTLEALKPLITDARVAIEVRGEDRVIIDNLANFFLTTSDSDVARATEGNRRFAVLYSAQQNASDLERDGMDGNYFSNLFGWLRNGGYETVAAHLRTHRIPRDLDPAKGCHRAPVVSNGPEPEAI